jgi:hypothetical protein
MNRLLGAKAVTAFHKSIQNRQWHQEALSALARQQHNTDQLPSKLMLVMVWACSLIITVLLLLAELYTTLALHSPIITTNTIAMFMLHAAIPKATNYSVRNGICMACTVYGVIVVLLCFVPTLKSILDISFEYNAPFSVLNATNTNAIHSHKNPYVNTSMFGLWVTVFVMIPTFAYCSLVLLFSIMLRAADAMPPRFEIK